MSHLAMHLRSNWSRSWSNTATCSEASPQGIGVGERTAAPETIASIVRWNEKWRFKHLEAHEWQPSARALQESPEISDPATIFPNRSRSPADPEERRVRKGFPEAPVDST